MRLIPLEEFTRIREHVLDCATRLRMISDMCRVNTLVAVKKAGSGHLGSSFSAMDIVVALYLEVLNLRNLGLEHQDRDIYFSSKGHDVPGLYSVLYAIGLLSEEKLLNLRRLHGLDGHPDVGTRGIEANTGSLGMGISKAKGIALGKHYLKRNGRVFVLTGDGELQEGQIWESLQTAAHQRVDLTVIVDHNKLQTDMPVEEIVSLGKLEEKFRAFNWIVERCDGHDFAALNGVFSRFAVLREHPKVLIADTVKGRGVSFMEEVHHVPSDRGKYLWHSGAPSDEQFNAGFAELLARLNATLRHLGMSDLKFRDLSHKTQQTPQPSREYVATAFGEELVSLAERHAEIIVLDGDLAADCRLRMFASKFPDKFIENGIAEQDMVSTAGGLARQGLLPIVNSFASFLAARANEQIYNNSCEGTKIIYVGHFAGIIPAGPGKSHQSVRDLSLFCSIPGLTVVQPCNLEECRQALRYCVEAAESSCMLRLNIGPSPRQILLPPDYRLVPGCGTTLRKGTDVLLFAYGPVMLHEALGAAELCSHAGLSLEIVNLPWLNYFDAQWLAEQVRSFASVLVVEDHLLAGGLGERLLAFLVEHNLLENRRFVRFGLAELPACGTPAEVLRYHALDAPSLAQRILKAQGFNSVGALPDSWALPFNSVESVQ